MKLTEEQYLSLIRYEEFFRTAIKSKYSRFPGSSALHLIHEIYVNVTGIKQRLNASCSTCILRLLTDMGNIYFKEKEERESRVNVIQNEFPVEEKVEVKTEKRKYRQRKPKTT